MNKSRALLPMFALPGLLLATSCANAAVQTPSAERGSAAPAEPDQMAAAVTVVTAISARQPDLLRDLIGDKGVAGTGFASGSEYAGYNNSDHIVAVIGGALENADPICVGYVPDAGALPDKAILVYRSLPIDWSRFGLSGTDAEGVTIQLFKLSDGWRLVYLTPFNFERDPSVLGTMVNCPNG